MILVPIFLSLLTVIIFLYLLKYFFDTRTYWFLAVLIIYTLSNFLFYKIFMIIGIFDFIIITFSTFISFTLFLTLVFNDSPSIFLYQIMNKKDFKDIFMKKDFIGNRLKLMKKSKLIKKNNITFKAKLTFKLSSFLSKILLKI